MPELPFKAKWGRSDAQVARDLVRNMSEIGPHERRLSEAFDQALTYEDPSPCIPAPLVIIAFTNRCGSNLFCEFLRHAGRAGGAGEFLNHDYALRRVAEKSIPSLPEYIADLAREFTTQGRGLAVKASWDQLAMLLRHRIPEMFSEVKVLHVVRNDLVRQAVSYQIALQNRKWVQFEAQPVTQDAETEPQIDEEQLLRICADVADANLRIRLLCDAFELPLREVSYEQMELDAAPYVARVLKEAGLAGPDWKAAAPRHLRQATQRNAIFRKTFLAYLRARLR